MGLRGCSGATAEEGQELGLAIGARRRLDPRTVHARALQQLLLRLGDLVAGLDQLGVEPLVGADRAGKVPGVDQVVSEELGGVLLA